MNAYTIYNSNLPTDIYQQYKMDMLTAHYIQQKLEEEKKKDKTNKIYVSPKRDITCSKCGQQYHWCNCDLKEKKEE